MKKKILLGSVIVLILLGLAYLGVGYRIYDKLARITPGGGKYAPNTPAFYKNNVDGWQSFDVSPYFVANYDSVRFPSRQKGLNLAGWYIPGDPGAPVVILTHGLNECKCSVRVLVVAGMLHRNGFNVLAYDLRNHGQSDIEDGRAALGNEEYQDLLGAWDWLIKEKHYKPSQIGIYGESMGAGTTLIAFGQEPKLAAAFVDSPYADLPEIISEGLAQNHYPTFLAPGAIIAASLFAGHNLIAFSPRDAFNNDAGRPIYIVHGTADQRVNIHHTLELQALASQTGANVTVWMPEGVGHVMTEFALPDEYEQRLVNFFRVALSH